MVGSPSVQDDRQRVLDGTDIVHLIGEHLTLKARGREYVALCPFHDDHKPSMTVVPHKQIFHCFSCGSGGNAIDFVMRYHGLEFREALELLASRANIELTPRGGRDARSSVPGVSKNDVARANEFARDFFRTIFGHVEHGAAARAMVAQRGISEEMVREFGIGAAPEKWDGLAQTLRAKGISIDASVTAGLLKKKSEGGVYDTFRNRLIFTIEDRLGRPIAFGGRKLREEDEPKYLNSPESPLFDKSSTLFGIRQAGASIQQSRTAIVTEGYTDVIACHQAGFKNVVASLGTALTSRHARVLRAICDTVILLFDGDEAGQRAADRAIEVFFREPLDVKIVVLPDDSDPDELLKTEGGTESFRRLLDRAVEALEYRFDRLRLRLTGAGLVPSSAAWTREVEDEIKKLREMGLGDLSPIRRHLVLRRLAQLSGVPEATILKSLGALHSAKPAPKTVQGGSSLVSPIEHAVGCLLCEPNLLESFRAEVEEILNLALYGDGPRREVAAAVLARVKHGQETSLGELLSELESGEARQLATALACEVERVSDGDNDRLTQHWKDCIRRIRLDAARSTSASAGESPDRLQAVVAALELKRQHAESLGGDLRILPRPETRRTDPNRPSLNTSQALESQL